MHGRVETVENSGIGTIRGDDGVVYSFDRPPGSLHVGDRVDYFPLGGEARDIRKIESDAAFDMGSQQALPATTIPTPDAAPEPAAYVKPPPAGPDIYAQTPVYQNTFAAGEPNNVWKYFVRALTKKYASGQGRARRMEYWGFVLFWWVFLILFLILDTILFRDLVDGDVSFVPLLSGLWFLGTIIPYISLFIRRLHDLGYSGWMYFLTWVPYIGGIIGLVFALIPGKPEHNQYGPNPKAGENYADAFT